jgi:hypothetical protein
MITIKFIFINSNLEINKLMWPTVKGVGDDPGADPQAAGSRKGGESKSAALALAPLSPPLSRRSRSRTIGGT